MSSAKQERQPGPSIDQTTAKVVVKWDEADRKDTALTPEELVLIDKARKMFTYGVDPESQMVGAARSLVKCAFQAKVKSGFFS